MEASPTVVCLDVPHRRRPSANLEGTLRAKQKSPIRVLQLSQLVSCVSLVALNMHCETFSEVDALHRQSSVLGAQLVTGTTRGVWRKLLCS